MRIALFTEVFTPKIDGVVTRLNRTLRELEELGHEAVVFASGNPPARHGVHRVVGVPSVSFRPWYPEIDVGLPARRIHTELRAFAPDIVHAVNPVWLAGYGVLAARGHKLPLLASYHTDVPAYTTKLGLSALRGASESWITWLHNRADVNLCTSQPILERARAAGIREVGLWPKAVDSQTYHPGAGTEQMRNRLSGGDPDAPLILYVGRLSREKDLDQLLQPVRALARQGARMAFVGSGPARAELERMFAGTPTTFVGYLSGAELASAYASADVFAFPSTTDTLGMVALEAMASGVPVVGADAGGIPYVVDDGVTGYVVTPGDTDALTDRLRQLLFDPGLRSRMGAAARADAERHTWRAATEAVVAAYQRAIDRYHRSCANPA